MSANTGIIDFALHPPLGLMSPTLGAFGPYSGTGTITAFGGRAVSNTFGVLTALAAVAAGYGYTVGWVSEDGNSDENIYEDMLGQVVVQHQLLSGAWVTTQLREIRTVKSCILWDVALPGRLGYYLLPGVTLDLSPLTL